MLTSPPLPGAACPVGRNCEPLDKLPLNVKPVAPAEPLTEECALTPIELERREGLQLLEPRAQRRHVRELRAALEVEVQRRVSMSRLSGTRRDPGTPRSIFTTLRGAGIQGYLDLRTPLC